MMRNIDIKYKKTEIKKKIILWHEKKNTDTVRSILSRIGFLSYVDQGFGSTPKI
jgi:hypothetical protein